MQVHSPFFKFLTVFPIILSDFPIIKLSICNSLKLKKVLILVYIPASNNLSYETHYLQENQRAKT